MNERFKSSLLTLTVAAVCLVAALWEWQRWQHAVEGEQRARQQLQTVGAQIEEFRMLKRKEAVVSETKVPVQSVLALANQVLLDAGIPTERFDRLDPQTDTTSLSGTDGDTLAYRKQSFLLNLRCLTPLEIGGFLERWNEAAPAWVPVRLELTHDDHEPDANHYRSRIQLSAVYLAQSKPLTESQP